MGPVVQKHFKTLCMDPQMRAVFSEGMVVGFKRYRNIKELVCRARLYDTSTYTKRPSRAAKMGWRKFSGCTTCTHSRNMVRFTCTATKEIITINQDISCKHRDTLYVIHCLLCQQQYVGKTVQPLMDRGRQHIQAVQALQADPTNVDKASKLYRHFATNGHSHADMLIFGIEKVHGDAFVLAARERYYIDKLETIYRGLNSNRT